MSSADFDRWISLRLGKRGETVFWYSTGELYDYPTGDVLAKVEGLEVTRSIVVGRYQVHQVSRKVYLFRDKDNNELLTEYHGGPVMPVTYKYQKIAYTLKGNVLVTEVKHVLTIVDGNSSNVCLVMHCPAHNLAYF